MKYFKPGDYIIRVRDNNNPCHFVGEVYEFIRYQGNITLTRKIKGFDYQSKDCLHPECVGFSDRFELYRPKTPKSMLDDSLFEVS